MRDASISYAAAAAVRGVSFSVRKGGVFALVGPNGAGKSTLLKAIAGRLPLSGGAIALAGAAAGSAAARRSLGVAPQRPALFDRLTATENVAIFARLVGMQGAEVAQRARASLEVAGLDPQSRTPAGRLSGGQRQRVNIAAAVVHDPALVVLDEPTAALDRDGVDDVDQLLRRLARRGIAILLVTHDLDQAERLADEVGVLCKGSLIAAAAPTRLKLQFGEQALAVRISADESAAPILEPLGFRRAENGRWSGPASDHAGVAALAERLLAAGVFVREIDSRAPSLADAVAAVVARSREAAAA
ncbi:MAG: ABC transporter ATP-binding protein [Parvularculaceae bacterium]|nr:ABC transporter ATP-binding protein [Parvularculaceae bacterium]